MANITAEMVKKLRDATGAGMMDCKKALTETTGDVEKAKEWLRKKGITKGETLLSRSASQGAIGSYVHLGGKIGVLIEVNCETDFAARNEEFQILVKDLAMQVAASCPAYIRREDVPQAVVEKERSILAAQPDVVGKPPQAQEKMVEGRLNKFFAQSCLMEQPFIKDPKITVQELVSQKSGKIGERISVRRFARFVLGEASEKQSVAETAA